MSDTPKHTSWLDTIAQIKQQMLTYQPPDDSEIYCDGCQQIDIPLPFAEFNHLPDERDIRCYAATAASDESWPPCPGDYIVMQHPLMIGCFTTALRKAKALDEFRTNRFKLPEERFAPVGYTELGFFGPNSRFKNFLPELQQHYIHINDISVIYGLYNPYHQGWVDNAAPRQCFFIDQFLYDNPERSNCAWDYTDALLRFDFAPLTIDLLRRHQDQLFFPSRSGIMHEIGFNRTHSSYYIIVHSPETERNHDWMR